MKKLFSYLSRGSRTIRKHRILSSVVALIAIAALSGAIAYSYSHSQSRSSDTISPSSGQGGPKVNNQQSGESSQPEETTTTPNPQPSTAQVTPSSTPTSPPKKPTPAPTAKTPAPAPAVATPSPNAFKIIVDPAGTTEIGANRTAPAYASRPFHVIADGSYSDRYGVIGFVAGGPGSPQSAFCSATSNTGVWQGNGNGTATVTVNYNAPVGIYTCRLKIELGYTIYTTDFKFELSASAITFL